MNTLKCLESSAAEWDYKYKDGLYVRGEAGGYKCQGRGVNTVPWKCLEGAARSRKTREDLRVKVAFEFGLKKELGRRGSNSIGSRGGASRGGAAD